MLNRILSNKDAQNLTKNYVALLAIQASNFILPLLVIPYLVRVLGAEKFGIVMIAQSVGVFLTVLVDFGFNISATRQVSVSRNKKIELSQYYWNVIANKFVLIVFAFVILYLLIKCFSRFGEESTVYYLSFLMVIGQAIFPTWFFQGIEKMKVITLVNVIAKILFTISIFLVIIRPEDYWLVPLCHGGGFIVSGAFGFSYSQKYIKLIRPKLKGMISSLQESSTLFVSNFATRLYTSSNTLILGIFCGDNIAGVYSSMEKLIIAVQNVFSPIYQAIFPWLAAKRIDFVNNFIRKMSIPIGILALFISLIIAFYSESILHFIYNEPQIDSNSYIFRILGISVIFSALNMLILSLYFPVIKAYRYRMWTLVIGGVFNFLLLLILTKEFNIFGVAMIAVSTEILLLLMALVLMVKKNYYE